MNVLTIGIRVSANARSENNLNYDHSFLERVKNRITDTVQLHVCFSKKNYKESK